jgi:hypothetical protein
MGKQWVINALSMYEGGRMVLFFNKKAPKFLNETGALKSS